MLVMGLRSAPAAKAAPCIRKEQFMFYIVVHEYVGPNPSEKVDEDIIYITRQPALTNRSREPRITGWCGSSNDTSITAHGAYRTRKAALKAIAERWGETREVTLPFEDSEVAAFRPGAYTPMTWCETQAWLYESLDREITADTSDAELEALEENFEAEANTEGYTLYRDRELLTDWLAEYRDELRADEPEDA
ncbi:hypothetical protein CLV79_11553 [Limimaricola soesokkakensis]|uniref:Uncharacterized protein n=2 Tax=Limimaricola soesokkakensis TaxID=1343159 RepID=A0A1X7A3C4_9RHOB|nr:hypothetical protein CLV79_11553 [Limimaricola soesokkakensis]SLN67528.1 hypothetical protein LOS8367_03376 [Limimaricola soesokkakensis]